jgi:hypothetical protein
MPPKGAKGTKAGATRGNDNSSESSVKNVGRKSQPKRAARTSTKAAKLASADVAGSPVRSRKSSRVQHQSSRDVLNHEGRERRKESVSEGGEVAATELTADLPATRPAARLARKAVQDSARKSGRVEARGSTRNSAQGAEPESGSHLTVEDDSDDNTDEDRLSVSDDEFIDRQNEGTSADVSPLRRGRLVTVSQREVRQSRPVRISGNAGVERRVDASASNLSGLGRFGYASASGKTPAVRQQPNAVRSPSLVTDRGSPLGCCEGLASNVRTSKRRSLSEQPRKKIDQSISMPVFDGEGDLELFLDRFDMLADYYEWREPERLFRLQQCIRGDAQYMLTDIRNVTSISAFVDILRQRFRAKSHAERYRAELSRLKLGTMTLEKLHLKVRGLVSKAYPGPWSLATEVYARDAFLTALGDLELRRRILMTCPPPETLEDAYDLAVRAVAVDDSLRTAHEGESKRSVSPRRSRHARAVATESSITVGSTEGTSEAMKVMEKRLEALQSAIEQLTAAQKTSTNQVLSEQSQIVTELKKPRSVVDRDTCRRCGEKGHWARQCPKSSAVAARPKANVISASRRHQVRVYLTIYYQGHPYPVLLDTGCDESILGVDSLPGISYLGKEQDVYAANEAKISILGRTQVNYTLIGNVMTTSMWVSDEIKEIIFGADWLEQNCCMWDFKNSTLTLRTEAGEIKIPMSERTRKPCVRRIFVRDSIDVPPRTQSNLPVKSVWTQLPMGNGNWTVEPRELQPGVMLARTLLAQSGPGVCVRVINCNNEPCRIEAGQFLAEAQRVGMLLEAPPQNATTSIRHVQVLIDNLPEQLTQGERERATAFIKSYAHAFSSSNTDLGRNRMLPHRINTGDRSPVRQPMRRQPYAQVAEIEKNVQELLAAKLIEPTISPWSSNVLLVRKKMVPCVSVSTTAS